ncbi:NF-X1 finger and helicase domain protein [Penicillium alfredii]|uniref:NF-X1 finger and helicase domain protein n=1 Tax=Penicillium alfredii TaxID=1506179 RepID=A0A9W9F8D1_9EURO|nr:NF-X1 finger and helicase domain protein [Penicillium alfredii]KAJ5095472.1 NF-X1 finger and helicase domain protein [Penicillium alfredii]
MVETARRRQKTTGKMEFEDNILQTKGFLQGTALILPLDLALLADFLSLARNAGSTGHQVLVQLEEVRNGCQLLINSASAHNRLPQQVEGRLFLVQLYALARSHSTMKVGEKLRQEAHNILDEARHLCMQYSGQTQGLAEEIDGAEKMLSGGTFYTAVTNEERIAVISAMAREFRGTGHWYYCRNGHPFTIGDCGAAMQFEYPECGSPVGGHATRLAEGVTRANDMERALTDELERNLGNLAL